MDFELCKRAGMLCVVNVAPSRENNNKKKQKTNVPPFYKLTEISHELQMVFCSGTTNFLRPFRAASDENVFKNCSLLSKVL